MQDNTVLKISEAQYVRRNHPEHNKKKRVHRTQRIVSTVVVVFCLAFLVFGGVKIVSAYTSAFQIAVDGEVLATLPTESEAKAAVARYLEEQSDLLNIDVVCDDNVKIVRVPSRNAEYSSIKDAVSALTDGAKVLARSVAVCVNAQPIMYVANAEAALDALEQAKSYYGRVGEGNVEDIIVVEEVRIFTSNVELEEILSTREAANMLLFGTPTVKYHFVETEGETFDYVANRYGISVEDIKEANPMVDSTNMAEGEAILLTKVNPQIIIQVKKLVVSREETPFETEQRDNYSIARGDSVVVEEGVPGEDEVTTEVFERNGVVVTQNRVSAITLVEPVTRVVDRGAKYGVVASRTYTGYLGSGTLGWPHDGMVTSRYGYRSLGYHTGLDIGGPIGSPVAASEKGTVVFADWEGSYGNLIKIDHGEGMQTYYSHLQAFAVRVGDTVTRGQMIGTVGRTGRTTGPHVHFEVRIDGQHYNPQQFLEPRQVEFLKPDSKATEAEEAKAEEVEAEEVKIEETEIEDTEVEEKKIEETKINETVIE